MVDMAAIAAAAEAKAAADGSVQTFAAADARFAALPPDALKSDDEPDAMLRVQKRAIADARRRAWSASQDLTNALASLDIARAALDTANAELTALLDVIEK